MTPKSFWRFFAPVLLLCALLMLLLRPSADAARDVLASRPVAAAVVRPAPIDPTVTVSHQEPTAPPNWSGLVIVMSEASVPIRPASEVPPAPPLSLPEPELSVATAPAQLVTPSPTATATATAQLVTPSPTATATVLVVPSPPTATATATALVVPSPPTATASVVLPPTAAPATNPPPSLDVRGRRALSAVGYDLASIGYTISFHRHTGSHRGLTFTNRRHIEIYIKPATSDAELAYIIGHEVGHAVDHIKNTRADRQRWAQSRGIAATTPWWPTGVGNDFATPAGDFAECFASWRLGSPSHSAWGPCGSMHVLMAELAR